MFGETRETCVAKTVSSMHAFSELKKKNRRVISPYQFFKSTGNQLRVLNIMMCVEFSQNVGLNAQ